MSRVLALLFTVLIYSTCGAPRVTDRLSHTQLLRAAEDARRDGELAAAADYFRRAYDARPRDAESLFQAAELYARLRNYAAAADAYGKLPANDRKWPLLGLKLGRNLVQSNRPKEAREVLERFQRSYNGTDRAFVLELARSQVQGLDVQAAQADRPAVATISRPGPTINTSAGEFGATAPAADLLFFSATPGGQSRLYQSRRRGASWAKAAVPEGFPIITAGEFGTGSLSADGRHFYFSICSGLPGEDPQNRCDIFYAARRAPGKWGQPRKLGPAVNDPAANNVYPFIYAAADGTLALYFASNRVGGAGGTDLYVAMGSVADPAAFDPAAPLAGSINTVGNETTPFYDGTGEGTLYFASDGHPGWGGLDIFVAAHRGERLFSEPENLGGPINTTAEDYGLSLLPAGQGGFLTSNRLGFGRTTTVETDLFEFEFLADAPRVEAAVYDLGSGEELVDYRVELYTRPGGKVLARRSFPTPTYSLPLGEGLSYRVLISKPGYVSAEYNVEVQAGRFSVYGLPVYLKLRPGDGVSPSVSPPGPDTRERGSGAPEIPRPTTAPAIPTAPATAPNDAASGTLYRIQVAAVSTFDPAAPRFAPLQPYGPLRSEPVPGKPMRRVTVGEYSSEAAAQSDLTAIQRAGFPDAYLVRYEGGIRQ